MLRDRPTLASVSLCLACLLALLPEAAAKPRCTQDVLQTLQVLEGKVPSKKSLDCRLYTPTILDYMQKCPGSTLRCFAGEVKVLTHEWEIKTCKNCLKLNRSLIVLASQFPEEAPDCLRCEHLKEEDAETFLQQLKLTIQKMNQEFCVCTLKRHSSVNLDTTKSA